MYTFNSHFPQILTSVLRVLIIVILMLSALTQLAAMSVPAQWAILGTEEAVVWNMILCMVILHIY